MSANWSWLPYGLLLSILALAVGFDGAARRIPNWLVLVGLFAGLACGGLAGWNLFPAVTGGTGFAMALGGALVGLACLLPFYALGAMGAGDVKLMAAVGTFLGPWQALGAVLLTFVAGGILALAAALLFRSLGKVVANLRLMLVVAMLPRGSGLALSDVQTTGRLPYALAVASGTGLQLWLASRGGWPLV